MPHDTLTKAEWDRIWETKAPTTAKLTFHRKWRDHAGFLEWLTADDNELQYDVSELDA